MTLPRRAVALLVLLAAATTLRAAAPLGAVEATAEEQLLIWTLNRARHDPPAYGRRIGVDLTGVEPQPPLAVSMNLTGSARFHAREMISQDYFAHVNPTTGVGPNELAVQNGYDLFGNGLSFDWGDANYIESIAFGYNSIQTFPKALALLIEDKGVTGLGHRYHLLAINPGYRGHREIGAGKASSGLTYKYAIHTGNVNASDLFLTGVVFRDADGDLQFDQGEGLGGVTVDAGSGRSATTQSAGGWSVRVPAGTYTVTCSGGAFAGTATADVRVTNASREIDFRSALARGEVDFGGTLGPDLTFGAPSMTGPAPLSVSFDATSSGQGTTFDWMFGDGATGSGDAIVHVFNDAGAYAVRLHGTDASGTGGALAVVCAEGAAGAGPGTTPPSSAALTATKLKAKAVFSAPGKDTLAFKGTMEMPAGWTPGLSDAQVVILGVSMDFPLADTDAAVDAATGSTFSLKYRKPAGGGGPLAAGVVAKVAATLKGDFAAVLQDAGLRNTTEKRTLAGVPCVVVLGGSCWRGSVKLAQTSKAGVKGAGLLVK